MVIGLIGGLVPVFQGWMFGVPGLILLARHFKWARRLLDWAKSKWSSAKDAAAKSKVKDTPEG